MKKLRSKDTIELARFTLIADDRAALRPRPSLPTAFSPTLPFTALTLFSNRGRV